MKIILSLLFTVQLCIASFYGALFFRGDSLHRLISDQMTLIELNFNERFEDYQLFLDVTSNHDVHASRMVFINEETIQIYTTDLTLNQNFTLLDGRFPEVGIDESISNFVTGESSQVGLFESFIPGFDLTISSLNNAHQFALDGVYYVHTSNQAVIDSLLEELAEHIFYVNHVRTIDGDATFLIRLISGFQSFFQLIEFIAVSSLLFLCVTFTSIQYAIGQLKSSVILRLHGYSKQRIVKLTVYHLGKYLMISALIACVISLVYSHYMGYTLFLGQISIALGILSLSLVLFYLFMVNLTVQLTLKAINSQTIVKGKKPNLLIQVGNHVIKSIFTGFLLITVYFSFINITQLSQRLESLVIWEKAQDIYHIHTSSIGQFNETEIEVELMNRQVKFYQYLTENYQAFIMHAENIWFLDREDSLIHSFISSLEISPYGNRITISPNYLTINPIYATNKIPIQEQINWDPQVWNLLVPEQFRAREDEIIGLYLEEFYFQQVQVENTYNEMLGLEQNVTEIDKLAIHIIYVENDQYYFSFDATIRPEEGGRILDPIAVIYTDNLHLSNLGAWFTSSLYFQTTANPAYDEILPVLMDEGLVSAIQAVAPVYDQNYQIIQDLQQQFIRLFIFTLILILANMSITYNLMANYFEQNKYKLFIKRTFGYSSLKRNKRFIITIFSYMATLILTTSVFLGIGTFLTGVVFFTFDLFIAILFERHLLKKSFAEILKGEH